MYAFLLFIFFITLYILGYFVSNFDRKFERGMLYGMMLMVCSQSLSQDIIGKDAFIAWVGEHWSNPWVSIPIIISTIILVLPTIFIDFNGDKKVL